jgi:hypothetical protein
MPAAKTSHTKKALNQETRTKRLSINLTPSEWRHVITNAYAEKKEVSDYARSAVLNGLKTAAKTENDPGLSSVVELAKVLLDEKATHNSAASFSIVIGLLEAIHESQIALMENQTGLYQRLS